MTFFLRQTHDQIDITGKNEKRPEQETEQRCLQRHDVLPADHGVTKLITYDTGDESKVAKLLSTFQSEYSYDDDGDVD